MTTTAGEAIVDLIVGRPEVRQFAEGVVVVALVVVLVEVEALRRRPMAAARRGSVSAVAAVLAIAWMMVVTQRFFDLL